jgi:hypothetical protein
MLYQFCLLFSIIVSVALGDCCSNDPILASCWGFLPTVNLTDSGDNSAFIHNASRSCGGKPFTIDFVSGSNGIWSTLGLVFNVTGQTISIEAGVMVLALRGAFQDIHDQLITIRHASGVTLQGLGESYTLPNGTLNSTMPIFGMWQNDYRPGSGYKKSEWRHGIAVEASNGTTLKGLRIENTGGDGIYIGGGGVDSSLDTLVEDCHTTYAYRNGMSVVGATNLLVDKSSFMFSGGTCCESGLDIEPETQGQSALNLTFRNSTFMMNGMIQVVLSLYGQRNNTIGITFDNCTIGPSNKQNLQGLDIMGLSNETKGRIDIIDTIVTRTGEYGITAGSGGNVNIYFTNSTLTKSAWRGHWPMVIFNGYVTFDNFTVEDDFDIGFPGRTWLMTNYKNYRYKTAVHNVTGSVTVKTLYTNSSNCIPTMTSKCNCMPHFGNGSTNIDLNITCLPIANTSGV